MKKRIIIIFAILLLASSGILYINKKVAEYPVICPIFPDVPIQKLFDSTYKNEYDTEVKNLQLLARCLSIDDLEKISEHQSYYALKCITKQISLTKILLNNSQRAQAIANLYDPDRVNYFSKYNDPVLSASSLLTLNENIAVFGSKQTGQNIPFYSNYKKIKYSYYSTLDKLKLYKEIGQLIEDTESNEESYTQIQQKVDKLKTIFTLETCCDSVDCIARSFFIRKAYKKTNMLSEPEYIK